MLKNKLIIFILILIGVFAGIFYWRAKVRSISEPAVFNPDSQTASKWYPYGGNALDFNQSGKQTGDFIMQINKKEKTIIIDSWPAEIKVNRVQVFNFGKLWDLQDHRVVFDLVNEEVKFFLSPPLPPATTTPPLLSTYLDQPYEIGKMPKNGFFNLTFYDAGFGPESPIFQKGQRYSIELYGKDENNQPVSAAYTTDF